MAVATTPNGAYFAAAGDNIASGRTLVVRHLFVGGQTAAGNYVFKNGAGTTLLTLPMAANTAAQVEWPFGEVAVDGVEVDAVPTAGKCSMIWA